jgi:hypothetical protein
MLAPEEHYAADRCVTATYVVLSLLVSYCIFLHSRNSPHRHIDINDVDRSIDDAGERRAR